MQVCTVGGGGVKEQKGQKAKANCSVQINSVRKKENRNFIPKTSVSA